MSTLAPFKALVRDTCAQTLALSGLTSPAARLRQRLSIITFHRVLKAEQRRLYPLPGLAVTPEELDAHLRFATRHFQCLPLASAVALWRSGRLGERPLLAVTFDDGQLDNHSRLRIVKREIARIYTVLREHELGIMPLSGESAEETKEAAE